MSVIFRSPAEHLFRCIASGGRPSSSAIDGSSTSWRPLRLPAPAGSARMGRMSISCSGSGSEVRGLTYKDAGVDIDAGSELVRRIAKMAPGIGGFGGLYPLGNFCCSDLVWHESSIPTRFDGIWIMLCVVRWDLIGLLIPCGVRFNIPPYERWDFDS